MTSPQERAEPRFDIEHVAHLARLELSAAERAQLEPQLRDILHYVDRLQELDTDAIEATFQVLPRVNVLREDVEAPGLDLSQALGNAPERDGPYFRMPRILEE